MALPLVWTALSSLKRPDEIIQLPPTLMPENPFYINNYVEIFQRFPFGRFFVNSFIVSIASVILSLLTCSIAGYAFAKFDFRGKEILFFAVLGTLMIPFQAIMIPLYLLFSSLGLVNTYLGILGPNLTSAFGVFLMRQFIEGLPNEYIDSARIDGCSEFRIFWNIILPLTGPALVTLGIIKFLWSWNEFTWPLLIVNTPSMMTVPLGLSLFEGFTNVAYNLIAAGATLSVLPMLIIFIFLQRHITKGMVMSGLKK